MRFSIRDLFLVTVIAAVCVAWWVDRSNLAKEVKFVNARLNAAKEKAERRKSLEVKIKTIFDALLPDAKEEPDEPSELQENGNETEGPVRGYELLGPPLPNFEK